MSWGWNEIEKGGRGGDEEAGVSVRLCVRGGFSASASLAEPATMAWFMSIWFSLGLRLPTPAEQDLSCPDFQYTAAQQRQLPKLFSTDLFLDKKKDVQLKKK